MKRSVLAVAAVLCICHQALSAPVASHSASKSVHAQFAAKDATIALLKQKLAVQQRTLDAQAVEIQSLKGLILQHNIPLPTSQTGYGSQANGYGQSAPPQAQAPDGDSDDSSKDPGQDYGDAIKRSKTEIRAHISGGGY